MPDHDTVLYNLAGIEQVEWGWGIEGDTHAVMAQLGVYGEETWFSLGDRDLALHIARTARVRAGARVTEACLAAQRALGIAARILPMTDDPVATEVRTADGWLEFQEYFVHQRQAPDVLEVRFAGIEAARADARGARGARRGRRHRHRAVQPARVRRPDPRRARACARRSPRPGRAASPVAAVSPIIGGKALKGPADRMLAALGHESSRARASRACTRTSSTST